MYCVVMANNRKYLAPVTDEQEQLLERAGLYRYEWQNENVDDPKVRDELINKIHSRGIEQGGGQHLSKMYDAFYLFCEAREVTQREQCQQAIDRVLQAAQDGTDIDLSPNDIATAKLYVRARALKELNSSIDTLIKVRDDPDAKGSERIRAAETLIARAIGPVEASNSIPFAADLSQASPTEIIDALIESVNTGAVSATFANTIKELLSAKVQSQKLEDMIAARSKTIEHVPIKGPAPNGHAPVEFPSTPPTWAQTISTQRDGTPPRTN